jgi:hypothetical protein
MGSAFSIGTAMAIQTYRELVQKKQEIVREYEILVEKSPKKSKCCERIRIITWKRDDI